MKGSVEDFYFNLYCERWSQPEPARMLASIPTVMMWDDHDIFDGWGSYPEGVNKCDVYQGIFASARDNFRAFQMQLTDTEKPLWLVGGGFARFVSRISYVGCSVSTCGECVRNLGKGGSLSKGRIGFDWVCFFESPMGDFCL